ncbi:centrosomal protein of 164 kDa [Anopheles nili]|uniref:centrosomal protein of 164 kDa n=1 Tax=Anopheles nili TaxID=185578 RepID=UPI00237B097C|nr:centrosomal protein of 164 kDa [Anopheles nili]
MTSLSFTSGFGQQDDEIIFSTYEPTKEEILEYAVKIGIDPDKETNILYLARQGLLHPLPENWKPCYSKQVKAYYYYDRISKKSQWEHPIDVLYRAKVIDARKAFSLDRSDSTSLGDSGFRSLKFHHSNSNQFDGNEQFRLTPSSSSGNNAACIPPSTSSPIGLEEVDNANKERNHIGRVNASCLGHANHAKEDKNDLNLKNEIQEASFGLIVDKQKVASDTTMVLSSKLSFNIGSSMRFNKSDTGESLDASALDAKSIGSGFTITGTGSQFLKSNKKSEYGISDQGRKPESEMKGILRDSSLTYVRSKNTPNDDSGADEKKSVRFDIDLEVEQTEVSAAYGNELAAGKSDDEEAVNINIGGHEEGDDQIEEFLAEEDDEGDEERLKQISSSDTSEQDSEISVGAVLTVANVQNTIRSVLPDPISNEPLGQRKADSLRDLRLTIDHERERYKAKLEEELSSLAELEKTNIENELAKERRQYEELLAREKQRLKEQHQHNIDEIKEFYKVKLHEMKTDCEEENTKEYTVYRETLQEEFDRRVKETTETHRATMATLQKNHDEIVEELERDLKMEEELLKKEHSTNLTEIKIKLTHELEMERQRMREAGEDRLYEKVRCEKRLLEDKYKCLKEKYTRLKTDVRISLERRKKRREQQQQQQQHSLLSNSYETDDRTNSKVMSPYSYEAAKGISVPSSFSTFLTTEKSCNSNSVTTVSSKRFLAKGANLSLEAKMKTHNFNTSGSSEPRQPSSMLYHSSNNNNNNNNNNNLTSHVDESSQSEIMHSKPLFQVRNIFSKVQHEDNFSSDSEFNKVSYERVVVENSCSSPQAAIAVAVNRPKRKIFTKTKSSSTSKLNSTKHEQETSARSCTPVENLRIQLKKLEELEDQIPDCNLDAPYHLRYPFVNAHVDNGEPGHGIGASIRKGAAVAVGTDSSELEFIKHRILLERDSVMRAKESLRTQKNLFKSKQRDNAIKHALKNKQTMDQIFHEEKELTELEVSLHRTRALLGEKVIRLRHLENSLQKLAEKDRPMRASENIDIEVKPKETLSDLSSYSSSGFSSTDVPTTEHHFSGLRSKMLSNNTEPSDTFIYLKHLHSEIKEIWSLLNPNAGTLGMGIDEMDFLNNATSPLSGKYLCDLVLPPKPPSPTFNQPSSATHSTGQQPMINQTPHHHYTVTLLEKTRDLKHWLRQAKNEHEMLKKKSFA